MSNTPVYDVQALIDNIKRRCSVPTSQLTYTEQDMALLANDTLQGEVVPLMMSAREEYFVDFVDITLTNSHVIPFPTNAVGAKLRSICFVQQTSPLVLVNLPRIDLDVVAGVGFSSYQTLAGFYIKGNDIMLYPSNSVPVGQTIRLYFYKRSLVLAEPNAYGRVLSIDSGTNTVQLDYVPPSWVVGSTLNSISSSPNFDITNPLMTVTAVSSPSIVVDSIEGLEIGDYMSFEGFSAVPQIPVEAHAYLAQLTAAKCLEGLGDTMGMESALRKAETLKTNLMIMVSQRVDGSVKKVMNPNGGVRLRAGLGRMGRRRYGGSW